MGPDNRPAFVFPFGVNGFLAVTQIVMIVYGYKLSDKFKIQYGFLAATVLMWLLPFASHFLGSKDARFWVCFLILQVFGVVNGMVQGQVFGLSSIFPPKYVGAVMLGNGLSGICMNGLKAILFAIIPDKLFVVALIFFIIAGLFLLLCALLYGTT